MMTFAFKGKSGKMTAVYDLSYYTLCYSSFATPKITRGEVAVAMLRIIYSWFSQFCEI